MKPLQQERRTEEMRRASSQQRAGTNTLQGSQRPSDRSGTRLESLWASSEADIQAAQALRWQVFTEEMGARLRPLPGSLPGLDVDLFDAHCEHLLVRTVGGEGVPPQVVGTYRVLTPDAARRVGGLYSDGEFDLDPLRGMRPKMAELGRSCTHPQWRHGGVIMMLWSALGPFLQRHGLESLIGCASVPIGDGGQAAAELWLHLRATHLAPVEFQVRPRLPLPLERFLSGGPADVPPLIKGYLRCGARVLGPPAWDPDFNTADLPMLLQLADLPQAYLRRFIGNA
jgi:putative hemolysin